MKTINISLVKLFSCPNINFRTLNVCLKKPNSIGLNKDINTFEKNIFSKRMLAKLFSIAKYKSPNIFCMGAMHFFAYRFGKIRFMTVSPNNVNGGMMKFKTNILRASTILALSLSTASTFAETTCSTPLVNASWRPYVGAGFGYGRLAARDRWEQITFNQTRIGKNNFNSKGFLGEFYAGMQKSVAPSIQMGGEIYGFLESHKASVNSNPREESLKRENGGGVKLKAGYLFDTHSALYAHVGAEKAGFKYAVSMGSRVSTAKKYLWGLPFGFGIETSFGSSWIARVEYTHVLYQKWKTGDQPLSAITTTRAKISPSQDSIVLGISYTL